MHVDLYPSTKVQNLEEVIEFDRKEIVQSLTIKFLYPSNLFDFDITLV